MPPFTMLSTLMLVALPAMALAQLPAGMNLTGVPQCAIECTTRTAGNSSCGGISNITCLCTSPSFQAGVLNCFQTTCTANDTAAATAFGVALCAGEGVNVSASSVPSAASSSHPPVASASAPANSSGHKVGISTAVAAVAGFVTLAAGVFVLA